MCSDSYQFIYGNSLRNEWFDAYRIKLQIYLLTERLMRFPVISKSFINPFKSLTNRKLVQLPMGWKAKWYIIFFSIFWNRFEENIYKRRLVEWKIITDWIRLFRSKARGAWLWNLVTMPKVWKKTWRILLSRCVSAWNQVETPCVFVIIHGNYCFTKLSISKDKYAEIVILTLNLLQMKKIKKTSSKCCLKNYSLTCHGTWVAACFLLWDHERRLRRGYL